MPLPICVVDAFTDVPFSGNPAAIVRLAAPAPDAWMQAVAAELNLSETAYVSPRADGDHDLRWFTPTVEVDLCGHATLAAAHVVGGELRFHTRSGVLSCTTSDDGTIALDFPASGVAPADPAGWGEVFGLEDAAVRGVYEGGGWTLVEVSDADGVRAAAPDREPFLARGGHAIVVADTTTTNSAFDSVCRVFAPASGIDEDPVTGSAHCVIAPWLAARHDRSSFAGRQASSRGGTVHMTSIGDRVELRGNAVTVWEGHLLADPEAGPSQP